MASELPLFEPEINALIKEYLSYAGLDKSSYSLVLECKERGKIIPIESKNQGDGSKLTAQNNILLEFDSGNYSAFWNLWENHIPEEIRHKDSTCQRLEFYIQIHFAVFPIRVGKFTLTTGSLEQSMTQFKSYLETKGSNLSQTTEFLPFYALPFVPNPVQHPSFKELFSNYWVPDLRARVDKFLFAALSVADPPLLLTLVKNKSRLEHAENASEQATKVLQQHLIQAERRCSAYMKRFNKLQTDYHTLISITAELVDSLEQTVQGKMVTVEYLQQVCARLFSNRAGVSINSVDLTRPGTASSILRASVAPDNFLQHSVDSPLLPSLDYRKIKSHLKSSPDRSKALLLQALRWRLTRSTPGEQRETVLLAYIDNDLFTCRQQFPPATGHFDMLSLFESADVAVRQYVARLYNALSSLQQGRAYLCMEPEAVGKLLRYLWLGQNAHNAVDHIFEEHLLGCLQKLSLRRALQSVMIRGDLIRWLVTSLSEHGTLSDYMLEYAVALLMNLCLRKAGKRKCGEIAPEILKILSELLAHDNHEIRPYVNGALYSVLGNGVVRAEARDMGLEATLRDLMDDDENVDFNRQLDFIIMQLNKEEDEGEDGGDEQGGDADSDDEGDEDDDEDQDAMEADLDKDEIVVARSNELNGEQLLCSEFLGIMTNSTAPLNGASRAGTAILQRPTTPGSYKRPHTMTSRPTTGSVQVLTINHAQTSVDTTAGRSAATDPTRPLTGKRSSRPNSRDTARKNSTMTPKSAGRSRQLPIDHEASLLLTELTGVTRHLQVADPQAADNLPPPVPGATKSKEVATAFSSRPRIPRTPEVTGSGRGPPPNPTFSAGEPKSRPSSGSSHSSGNHGSSTSRRMYGY